MFAFTSISIDSDCCQIYNICGEHFSKDIIFNEDGKVVTTKFNFLHLAMKVENDYIKQLKQVQHLCDQYSSQLTTYPDDDDDDDDDDIDDVIILNFMKDDDMLEPFKFKEVRRNSEKHAPTVFAYSAYYIYTD